MTPARRVEALVSCLRVGGRNNVVASGHWRERERAGILEFIDERGERRGSAGFGGLARMRS